VASVFIRGARRDDVAPLAASMRPEDAAEVLAAAGQTPAEALADCLERSILAYSLEADGELIAMFGLAGPLIGDRVVVWALTGAGADRHPLSFHRLSRAVVARFLELYPALENMVDARHEKSLRWLRRLGAEIEPAQPYGAAGFPFHHITFRKGALPWAGSRRP
jgi:hypothetical protein